MAFVSMISLNLKTIIKSIFRLCFSRLNKPSPLDFHHRADFSNLFIISVGFLWILSKCYIIKSWTALQEKNKIVWQPYNVTLLHLYALFISLCELSCLYLHRAISCLQVLVLPIWYQYFWIVMVFFAVVFHSTSYIVLIYHMSLMKMINK